MFAQTFVNLPCKSLEDICGYAIASCVTYIQRRRPTLVVFDDLDTRVCFPQPRAPQKLKCVLEQSGYRVEMAVVKTQHHGIPLSRNIFCIVAVRSDAEVEPFKFPNPIGQVPRLIHFLTVSRTGPFMVFPPGALARSVTDQYPLSINACGIRSQWRVLDPFASVTVRRLILSVHDVGALQGLPAKAISIMLVALDNDQANLRGVLEDAMPVNVSMRIMSKALFSAGLVSAPLPDHWSLVASIVTGASDAVKLPDALYTSLGST